MTLYGLNVHPSFPFMGLNSPLLSPFTPLPPPPPTMSKPNFVRITFNCGGYSPKSIKTDVYGTKVVISGREEARIDCENYSVKEFKRSYELPVNADGERLASYMAPNGQLLIEVPLKNLASPDRESPTNSSKKVMAPNANDDSTTSFSVTYQLPENIDPSKLNITCRDRDLIIQTVETPKLRYSDHNTNLKKIPINYLN